MVDGCYHWPDCSGLNECQQRQVSEEGWAVVGAPLPSVGEGRSGA